MIAAAVALAGHPDPRLSAATCTGVSRPPLTSRTESQITQIRESPDRNLS